MSLLFLKTADDAEKRRSTLGENADYTEFSWSSGPATGIVSSFLRKTDTNRYRTFCTPVLPMIQFSILMITSG